MVVVVVGVIVPMVVLEVVVMVGHPTGTVQFRFQHGRWSAGWRQGGRRVLNFICVRADSFFDRFHLSADRRRWRLKRWVLRATWEEHGCYPRSS